MPIIDIENVSPRMGRYYWTRTLIFPISPCTFNGGIMAEYLLCHEYFVKNRPVIVARWEVNPDHTEHQKTMSRYLDYFCDCLNNACDEVAVPL